MLDNRTNEKALVFVRMLIHLTSWTVVDSVYIRCIQVLSISGERRIPRSNVNQVGEPVTAPADFQSFCTSPPPINAILDVGEGPTS